MHYSNPFGNCPPQQTVDMLLGKSYHIVKAVYLHLKSITVISEYIEELIKVAEVADTIVDDINTLKGLADKLGPILDISNEIINISNNIEAINTVAELLESIPNIPETVEKILETGEYVKDFAEGTPRIVESMGDVYNSKTDGYFWVKNFNDPEHPNYPPTLSIPLLRRSVKATGSTKYRLLEDRFADVVNVKDYGAKGDGVTDDTAAFNAASQVSESVFVPHGLYKITALLTPSQLFGQGVLTDGNTVCRLDNALTLYCSAVGGSHGLLPSCPCSFLEALSHWGAVKNIQLSDGLYSLTDSVYLKTNLTGNVENPENVILDFGSIDNGNGVYIENSVSRIIGVTVKNSKYSGFRIDQQSFAFIKKCNSNENARGGFDINNASTCYLTNCSANNNGTSGFIVALGSSASLNSCTAEGNLVNGYLFNYSANSSILNSSSKNNGAHGIYASGTVGLYAQNVISDGEEIANFLASGGAQISLNSCQAKNSPRAYFAEYSSILTANACSADRGTKLASDGFGAFTAEYGSKVTIALGSNTTINGYKIGIYALNCSIVSITRPSDKLIITNCDSDFSPLPNTLGNSNSYIDVELESEVLSAEA